MGHYIIRRLLLVIPTLIGVTLIGFLIMRLAPGDPAELRAGGGLGGARQGAISRAKGGDIVDETVKQWRQQYGLDKPSLSVTLTGTRTGSGAVSWKMASGPGTVSFGHPGALSAAVDCRKECDADAVE